MGYLFKFKFSENDIDFKPKTGQFFNYEKFLINEFFNSTDAEMDIIMRNYEKIFGSSALKYVMKTYYSGWRRGNRTLSNIQHNRIIKIMPSLLNKNAQEALNTLKEKAKYKLGIEEVIGGIQRTVHYYFQNQHKLYSKDTFHSEIDIQNVFNKEIDRVQSMSIVGFFYVLDNLERDEVIQISKYITLMKLKKQFDQIERDIKIFRPFIQLAQRGEFSAVYKITAFNNRMELAQTSLKEIIVPEILIEEITANSRFKAFSDKFLAGELININSEANKAISSAFLNAHDLDLFFNQYAELSNSISEVKMKSTFKGEGGVLDIQIQMKPSKIIRTSIAKSYSKITISTIIITWLVLIAIRSELFLILLLGGVLLIGFYINLMVEEITLIKKLKKDIKKYG